MGLNSGPPMTPGAYNNNFQLFQTPEYVVILNEMIHDARIIPLDGRPHGRIRQWKGDSRGHWEGNTLVVDTTNFKRETSLAEFQREHCTWSSASRASTLTHFSTSSRSKIRRCGRDHGRQWFRCEERRSHLRIRMSRGELRHGWHPCWSARRREGRGRGPEDGIEVSRRTAACSRSAAAAFRRPFYRRPAGLVV